MKLLFCQGCSGQGSGLKPEILPLPFCEIFIVRLGHDYKILVWWLVVRIQEIEHIGEYIGVALGEDGVLGDEYLENELELIEVSEELVEFLPSEILLDSGDGSGRLAFVRGGVHEEKLLLW